MMQNIVDSPLNLQLDNYYLIDKGEISFGESFNDTTKWLLECLSHVQKRFPHTMQYGLFDCEFVHSLYHFLEKNVESLVNVWYLQFVHHL